MAKKYDIKKGSATFRHKMREAYKGADMKDEMPEKLSFKAKALKKMKKAC